ncbi:unnamed protein product, partial [Rotaria sordida]
SLFDSLFSRHGLHLISSLQVLIEMYVHWLTTNSNNLCIQLKFELIHSFIYISLISYNLCKSGILLEKTTKENNQLYIRLIEHNFKLTKIHAYASCLFLLESH